MSKEIEFDDQIRSCCYRVSVSGMILMPISSFDRFMPHDRGHGTEARRPTHGCRSSDTEGAAVWL